MPLQRMPSVVDAPAPATTDRLVPLPHVLCVRNDGDTVLLDAVSGRYFGLNLVGTDIWEGILDGKPLSEIIGAIRGKYDASETDVSGDVLRIASALIAHELVQVTGQP